MRPADLKIGDNWRRVEYAKCAAMGARKKMQAVETNIEEMEILRSKYNHSHSKGEWDPEWDSVTRKCKFPSKVEA